MFYQPDFDFEPKNILVYLRKSRSDDPLLSVEEVLEKHETILDEWTENRFGAKVPEENKYREVVSGETLKERPEILTVLKLIESPKYKAISVVEPQRLTRGDLEDIGRLMKLLKHTNTLVITPVRTYDLHDEYDWDMLERELKRGNDYLEYTKKILNRGRLLSVSQGNFIGSLPPYGYDKTWVTDGRKKCPTLKINEEQAEIVRLIFKLYVADDYGYGRICNYLDTMGVPPLRGEHWSPAHLKDLLANVHYIGKVRWNWRKTVTIVDNGEIVQTRPKAKKDEYMIYDGKHEPIISEELFYAAQNKQGKNARVKNGLEIRNPLAGLLFCECGRAMSYRTNTKDGVEKNAPRYVCNGQKHCNNGSCTYFDLICCVCSALQQFTADFEIKIKNQEKNLNEEHKKRIASLEKKLKALNAKELAIWEAQADPNPENRMPQKIFKQLNAKLIKEKDDIKAALNEAQTTAQDVVDYNDKVIRLKDVIYALNSDEISPKEKNRIFKSCISRIEYHKEKPYRIKREANEKKGERFTVGGQWSIEPIHLNITLAI